MIKNENIMDLRFSLEINARRIIEDCVNSSKNNFLYSTKLKNWSYLLGIISIVGPSVVISLQFISISYSTFFTVLSSIATLVSVSINVSWVPNRLSRYHFRVGNEYLSLQKKVQSFVDVDLKIEHKDPDELIKILKSFSEEQINILKFREDAIIPERIFKKVRKKIESGEAKYAVDNIKD